MKKRLLSLVTFVLAFAGTVSAYEVGDYAYNATQRLKITGENQVTNGDFANGLDGWYGVDKETSPNVEVWSITEGAGPNGEKVVESVEPKADQPLCFSWQLPGGSYVVSYDIKTTAPKNIYPHSVTTSNNVTTVSIPADCADFFINTTGDFARVASTDEAPVKGVASMTYVNDEWTTVCFFFTIEEGQNLIMHFEKLAAGTQFTNIEIHEAEQVYDIRKAQNRFSFARDLMANPLFDVAEAQEAKDNLASTIESLEGMIETGDFDDASNAESMMAEFETEYLEPFLAVTSVDAKTFIPGLDIASQDYYGRGGIGNRAAKYKLDLSGNWGHLNTEQDVLRSAIQNGYAHEATYKAYHEDFPAGKYFFICEIRNANTGKISWPTEPVFNLESQCKMFIGTDTIDLEPISGTEFKRFSMVADVKEDGGFYAGVYWPGVSSGGAFFIRNTMVRAFNKDIATNVEHIQAFKEYVKQWDAATSGRKAVYNLVDNANYPWGQNELKEERDRLEPYYTNQRALQWSSIDGVDTGIASTEELNDWALYQGFELYSEPDAETGETKKLEYQLVRGYQGAANAIKATNKIFTDLADAIVAAKKTRNTGAYLTGDRDAYKTAILAALATLNNVRSTTTDATRDADSTALGNALEALNAATTAFLATVTITPFIDIDFSKGVTENEDIENYSESFYFQGEKGRMYTSSYNETNTGNTSFTLGYNEDYLEVLRVGNGSATVYLTEADQPGENEALRVSFDFYHGNLSGKNAGIELQNAEGKRVAGFSLNRYNGSLAYNDFNDVLTNGGEGMNILKYATGVGSSSQSNAAIAAESNRTTYTLVVDYQNKTLQGTINNAKNGTCEGKEMPFIKVDNPDEFDYKIVKFVLMSNYNNADRRCWFDNLKISKYPLTSVEEDITEDPWIATTDWEDPETVGVKTVKSVAADNSIYTLSGVRVEKASKPGLYIKNGKKVVIK